MFENRRIHEPKHRRLPDQGSKSESAKSPWQKGRLPLHPRSDEDSQRKSNSLFQNKTMKSNSKLNFRRLIIWIQFQHNKLKCTIVLAKASALGFDLHNAKQAILSAKSFAALDLSNEMDFGGPIAQHGHD